ncbi:valine--tRNA ligase [Chloroflexota bacterium]
MPRIENEMPKAYEAGKIEQKWYQFWLDKGYFTPKIDPTKKPFVIIMPPPNITGELHIGHALTATLEDAMTRWHRMKGEAALWLPGIDHAGIAAQLVVERQLAKEGLTKEKLGREKFEERVWQWANKCRSTISMQHRRLGASCDWTRECFTMDKGPCRAVRTAFVHLYDKGLIYRGERIINWCPRCSTALSDLEVEHKDVQGHLWYVRYQIKDSSDFITVATTRPETILGDTAVAVNPNDDRYKHLVGKTVILPAINREIPIVGDEAVDPTFGTGAVKITPAHDPVDFEVAQRNHLPLINILNADATMNENAGPYQGTERFACREAIIKDLEKDGQMVKIEPYSHAVAHCFRCKTIVEPIASRQWFVKAAPLAEPAIKAVTEGRIRIVPERFNKVYLNWMENIRDWCISRQLWWGHRIPVWYCADCGEVTVRIEDPVACCKCGSARIEQDQDVLDTWFSSGLWPHSTLGWPDDTEDLRYFYPTTVMETGYDILFFWVARMIMMGIEDTEEIPFHIVYLHGLIRDERGEKMSKMKGNVLNPIVTSEQYGTDAMRFAVSTGTSPGNDVKLTTARLEAGRNFANKLWNAARFVIRSIEGEKVGEIQKNSLAIEDCWIMNRLNRTIENVTALMKDYQFGEAQRQIYDFLWGEYCDWYIEISKTRIKGTSESPLPVLAHVLETSLRLLHPYMPFITEELWQNLKMQLPSVTKDIESIMIAPYPATDASYFDPEAERIMDAVIEIVRGIRNARAGNKVDAGRWIEAQIHAGDLASSVSTYSDAIRTLAKARPVNFYNERLSTSKIDNALVMVLRDADIVLPMAGMVDVEVEKKRIQKDMEGTQAEIGRLEARLNDAQFTSRAPPAVVEKERDKLTTLQDKLERLRQQIVNITT